MNPLLLIRVAVVAAIVAGTAAAGWTAAAWKYKAEIAVLLQVHAQALQAEAEKARTKEALVAQKIEEVVDAARKVQAAVQADAQRAAATAGGLRNAVAAVAARCSAPNPSPAGGGPAEPSPGVLLAELSERLEQRSRELAEEADRRGGRHQACVAQYDEVRRTYAGE